MKLDMQGTVGGTWGGGKRAQRETFSVKYSSSQRYRSPSAPGHIKLCTVTTVTGQSESYQQHGRADVISFILTYF